MNRHIFLDSITATVAGIACGSRKFFAESLDSSTFFDLIRSVETRIPTISQAGIYEIEANTPAGNLDPAFKIEKWLGFDFPTIIYHHGNNERPFDLRKGAKNTFQNIFATASHEFNANLIVVRAPFHNCSMRCYLNKMLNLSNFMTMISVSVDLTQSIIAFLGEKGSSPVITCGISLGGWVTNLHRSFYNTSSAYAPLLAGTSLAELFLRSKYRKLTSGLALRNPDKIRQLLNFDFFYRKTEEKNVFPLLARYDQFIEYDIQKCSYQGHLLKTIEAGHVTGALSTCELRSHILDVLNMVCAD